MRLLALLLLASVIAPFAIAGPPEVVVVPSPTPEKRTTLKVPASQIVTLQAQPASKWRSKVAPPVFENGKFAVFLLAAGEEREVTVTGPDGADTLLLLVGSGDPKPDDKKPPPEDVLKTRLRIAYDADPAPAAEKAKNVKKLASLYAALAESCADPTIKTSDELRATATKSAKLFIGDGVLMGIRRDVVAPELAAILPPEGSTLTQTQRDAAAALFRKLAQILEGF